MGLIDTAILCVLASHIPITLLIDAQVVAPAWVHPPAIKSLLAWHVSTSGDPLVGVGSRPPWFTAIVWGELLLQVPYFAWGVAVYGGWVKGSPRFRDATLVYSAHVVTTMIAILGEFVGVGASPPLLAAYLPYLVFPLLLLWQAAGRKGVFAEGGVKRA